jgi:signal transduction histidine kinase
MDAALQPVSSGRDPLALTAASARRDYWICQLAGWGGLTLIGILGTAENTPSVAWRFAVAKLICVGFGILLSHLWRNWLRRHRWLDNIAALPLGRLFAGLLILAVTQSLLLIAVDFAIRDGAVLKESLSIPIDLSMLLLLWFIVFFGWTMCYAVALSRRRAVRVELEKLALQVSAKDAELRALQAQVNPHFFFNSLNSIRALAYQDADATGRAISQLAGMMRYSLQSSQQPTASLAEELAAVQAYLELEKLHLEERLQLEMHIAADLDKVVLPRMLLQTLAENAVKYGVEPSLQSCCVRISARRSDDDVVLEVANQGKLASSSESTRLGLANGRQRLALLFGASASLSLTEDEGWVVARVRLPQLDKGTQ